MTEYQVGCIIALAAGLLWVLITLPLAIAISKRFKELGKYYPEVEQHGR